MNQIDLEKVKLHMSDMCSYQKDIATRSRFGYLKGLIPRYVSYLRNEYIVWVVTRNGTPVGQCVTMPYGLAKRANRNLNIGNHVSVQTDRLDLRSPVKIGDYAIIGADVEIITTSHNVDSRDWEHKYCGIDIEAYYWLATRVYVLPSCRKIGRGAVCAAGSVVAKDVPPMTIVTGNPANPLRERKKVHADLCVESLLGNDYLSFVKAYKTRQVPQSYEN